MNRLITVIIFILAAVCMTNGCSGGGSPVVPAEQSGIQEITPEINHPAQNNTYIMSYYDCYFDIESQTFEAVENRQTEYTLNVVPFLNLMTNPYNGIAFSDIVVHTDDPSVLGIDVNFHIAHPLPGLLQYNAYDMMGVIIQNGHNELEYGHGIFHSKYGTDQSMLNPDGYSRWFNPYEFTSGLIFGYESGGWQNDEGSATLNPFKYYATGLGAHDDLWDYLTEQESYDGLFTDSPRWMQLEFPLPYPALRFGYAVVVAWEDQGEEGPYIPYHRTEAIACSASSQSDVWYDAATGNSGGDLILDINLYSWDLQPDKIIIESTVLNDPEEFDYAAYSAYGGKNYSTWHVEVPSDEITSTGGQEFWVIAEYSDYDYKNGMDLPSPDDPLAAFFRYGLYVAPEEPPYVPDVIVTSVDGFDGDGTLAYLEPYLGISVSGQNFLGSFIDAAQVQFIHHDSSSTIFATNVDVLSGTQITCDVDFSSGATYGSYDVKVINEDLTNGKGMDMLSVCTELTDVTSLDLDTSTPGIQSEATPDQPYIGVEIKGDGFYGPVDNDAQVTCVHNATGTEVPGYFVKVIDSQTIECNLDFSGVTHYGIYDIKVTNKCGSENIGLGLLNLTTIGCEDVAINSTDLNPDTNVDEYYAAVNIYGSGFVAGPNLSVDLVGHTNAPVIIVDTGSSTDTHIVCSVDFAGVDTGTYSLRVENDCGKIDHIYNVTTVHSGSMSPPVVDEITGEMSPAPFNTYQYEVDAYDPDGPTEDLWFDWRVTRTSDMMIVLDPPAGQGTLYMTFDVDYNVFSSGENEEFRIDCMVSDVTFDVYADPIYPVTRYLTLYEWDGATNFPNDAYAWPTREVYCDWLNPDPDTFSYFTNPGYIHNGYTYDANYHKGYQFLWWAAPYEYYLATSRFDVSATLPLGYNFVKVDIECRAVASPGDEVAWGYVHGTNVVDDHTIHGSTNTQSMGNNYTLWTTDWTSELMGGDNVGIMFYIYSDWEQPTNFGWGIKYLRVYYSPI